MEENKELKFYKEKFVAFIDILGFKNIISQDVNTGEKYINFFTERIKHILNVLDETWEGMFSVKMFSDCICISCDNNSYEMSAMLSELSFMQLFFSLEGIFIRGALTIGLHFENDHMIFSQGLIKAYELEQNAIYPRIILDENVVKILFNKENGYIQDDGNVEYVMHSPDGIYFLDYLDTLYEEGIEQDEFMLRHKQSILNQVNENLTNNKILEKYRWLAEYHNHKFREFYNPEDWNKDNYKDLYEDIIIPIESIFPSFKKKIN
jgi:hypothetical protein